MSNAGSRTAAASKAPTWKRAPAGLGAFRRLYALLLRALPGPLRRDYGGDMLRLADELYRDAHAHGGPRAAAGLAARSTAALLSTSLGARAQQLRRLLTPRTHRPHAPRHGGNPLRGLHHDIRLGLRSLIREPAYAAMVVFTLALAISVNSTMFSMVRMLLVPPVPFDEVERLVFPFAYNQELNRQRAGISLADLQDLAAASDSLAGLTAQRRVRFLLAGSEEPVRVGGVEVTTNYFELLGMEPAMGRGFLPEESAPGSNRVLVITPSAWQNRFGGDPGILGSVVMVDGTAHTVVGVLPEEAEAGTFRSVELYRPVAHDEEALQRDRRDLFAIGRLAPGATIDQARTELLAASEQLAATHPDTNRSWAVGTLDFRAAMVGSNAAVAFGVMSGAVLFVLLIACINVANLTLARATARGREITVRVALGARRWRIVRQLLIESTVLALLAGAVGLLMTSAIFDAMVSLTRGRVGMINEMRIDTGMLIFTLVLSLATPILFALWPAMRASSGDLSTALKSGDRGTSFGRSERRRRSLLVASQIALAVTLLVLASLTSRSMYRLMSIDLGFDASNLLTFQVELTPASDGTETDAYEFFAAARDQIASIPGVGSVGLVSHRPILGGEPLAGLQVAGDADGPAGDSAMVATVVADPGFFDSIGLPIVAGRSFDSRDLAGGPVAIISQAAAERYWADSEPIGSQIRVGGDSAEWREVIGIVADLRNPDANMPPEPHAYLPFAQRPLRTMAFMVRSSVPPAELAGVARDRIWQIDPLQPIDDVRTMRQIHRDDFGGDLAIIVLIAFFGVVAFGLAVAGVYGVVSYSVSQRRREIGVRMAVGARSEDVLRMVTRQGLTQVLVGVVVGIALGLVMSHSLTGLLYGITPTDPVTFLGIPLVLSAVGLLASLIPARRAARLDPIDTLRAD